MLNDSESVESPILFIDVRMIDHRETGRRHRKLRTDAGLTLKQVSETSGYSLSFIAALETGSRSWTEKISAGICSAIHKLSLEKMEL